MFVTCIEYLIKSILPFLFKVGEAAVHHWLGVSDLITHRFDYRTTDKNENRKLIREKGVSKLLICGISLTSVLDDFSAESGDGNSQFEFLKKKGVQIKLYFWRPNAEILKARAWCEKPGNDGPEDTHKDYIRDAWISIGRACLIPYCCQKEAAHPNLNIYILGDNTYAIMHFITDRIAVAGYYGNRKGPDTNRVFVPKRHKQYNSILKELEEIVNNGRGEVLVETSSDGFTFINKKTIDELLGLDADFAPNPNLKKAIHSLVENYKNQSYQPQDADNLRSIIKSL